MSDRVRDTLTALRVDADAAPLAAADQVRRRGQARTRHQAVAGLAAVVVLIVIGAGAVSGLGGTDKAQTQLPASPTPTAKAIELAVDPLLRADDVTAVGVYESLQRNPDPVDETARPMPCMPSPTTLGAPEGKAAFYYSDLDATFIEHVLRFPDEAAAGQAVSKLAAAFASCNKGPASSATVVDDGPTRAPGADGVGETLHASRLTTPKTDGEVSYYELGAVRTGNVVVALEWSSMGNPYDSDKLVWSDELFATAVERATG
jgi:hypothetical protein